MEAIWCAVTQTLRAYDDNNITGCQGFAFKEKQMYSLFLTEYTKSGLGFGPKNLYIFFDNFLFCMSRSGRSFQSADVRIISQPFERENRGCSNVNAK